MPACLTDLFALTPTRDGDIYLTGTPGGTAAKMPKFPVITKMVRMGFDDVAMMKVMSNTVGKSPDFLKDGDEVEITIRSPDGVVDLGTQRNTVRDADPKDYPGEWQSVVGHWGGARVGRVVLGGYLASIAAAFAAGRGARRAALAVVAAYFAAVLLTVPKPKAKL